MRNVVFFFQAEDGIRDLVRSRGLGDVYKRQPKRLIVFQNGFKGKHLVKMKDFRTYKKLLIVHVTVSYTHLTLPTSDLV